MSFHLLKSRFSTFELKALNAHYPDDVVEVTSLQTLLDREASFNTMCDTHCQEVRDQHVVSHMDDYYPVIYDINSHEVCDECNTPKFPSYNKVTKQQVQACFGCIEALRLVSIKHDDDDSDVCVACEVRYDDYGFPIGVHHQQYDIEDYINPDGDAQSGMKTKIASGLVHRYVNEDENVDVIFISGEPIYF